MCENKVDILLVIRHIFYTRQKEDDMEKPARLKIYDAILSSKLTFKNSMRYTIIHLEKFIW